MRLGVAHNMARMWVRFTLIVYVVALFPLSLSAGSVRPVHAVSPGATATAVPTAAAPQPASAYPTLAKEAPSARSIGLRYSGKPVDFELTGLEPDFDPIYKLTVSTTLHDLRVK